MGRFQGGNVATMQCANGYEEQRRAVRLKDLRQSRRSSFDHAKLLVEGIRHQPQAFSICA